MIVSRLRSVAFLVAVGAAFACACGSSGSDESVGESAASLSFSSGNNDGYCASNPSAGCGHGTPLGNKQLALTFDDGPGSQTAAFSSWLASQGIRATFFQNGMHFDSTRVALLTQIESDGHLIGNHTQDHLDLTTLGDSQIVSELADTDVLISPFVASSHFVFRAPFGSWSSHDYDVLQASAMSKYVGPVKWDIGGQMTNSYGADWDCWQNQDGYGVMTTKQCGDRYLQEIADVGRGIVLMHDQDYGDSSNHNLTSGTGNTIDMVKYMVPILKQQGYSFVRIDEVPDIASQWTSAPDAGKTDSGGGGGTCAFNPTWQQTQYANEWWIEYSISGNISSASLEVVGGATTALTLTYGKWIGGPNAQIPTGAQVIVHAKDASNNAAQTQPFAYLVVTNPVTACGTSGDAGSGVDAGHDAGTIDAGHDAGAIDAGHDSGSDAGACSTAFNPTWSQGSGANNWWVEYAITTKATVTSAWLEVPGVETVPLSLQWSKWVGPASARIATGTSVIVHATDSLGESAQTKPFGFLSVKAPLTQTCGN